VRKRIDGSPCHVDLGIGGTHDDVDSEFDIHLSERRDDVGHEPERISATECDEHTGSVSSRRRYVPRSREFISQECIRWTCE